MIPSVTATAACRGLRPVAKALGASIVHRNLRARGQPAHDRVQPGRLRLVDRLGAVHREDDLVREPVGDEIHDGGEHEAHDHALLAGDGAAAQDEEGREDAQEEPGLQHIGHRTKGNKRLRSGQTDVKRLDWRGPGRYTGPVNEKSPSMTETYTRSTR